MSPRPIENGNKSGQRSAKLRRDQLGRAEMKTGISRSVLAWYSA